MSSILLYLRMALRRRVSVLLVVVFAAAVTGFLLSYPRLMDRTRVQLEHAYDSITVTGEILHADGHSTPVIRKQLFRDLLDSGYLGAYAAGTDYGIVFPKKYQIYSLFPGFAPGSEELAEEISTVYTQKNKDNAIKRDDPLGTAKGITELAVYNPLLQVRGDIQWLEGYDESCLSGSEAVAILPENYGYALGDTVCIAFAIPSGYAPLRLKVVGLAPLSSESSLFLPLSVMEAAYEAEESVIPFRLTSMKFDLADSRKTFAFGDFVKTLKDKVQLNIRLDDEIFRGTIDPIQSNLKMLEGLYPVFFAAVAAIGFVLCFLLVRRRKQEFAVMRLLGETGMQITGKALLEQAMLCVIGIMLGVTAVLVSGLGEFSPLTCGGVLLCYSIGSALAVMLMVRVNVMEILRDKE